MITRLLSLPSDHHFFLFGPRNTGKGTLLAEKFSPEATLFINLLDSQEEDRFTRAPRELIAIVSALPDTITHVVIDEIQKIPRLLDIVHHLIEIEKTKKKFIMTGSSARKLKHGGANLLAGRALVRFLYPFSVFEIEDIFDLDQTLHFGLLPTVVLSKDEAYKKEFLYAYALTYLKEEIWVEQFIKKLDPFRYFLEIAAQMNGKIINFAKISRDVGVDDKTIKQYYSILEDTLIGFFLEPFHHSFRKRLTKRQPKFYFFDVGVQRALARLLSVPVLSKISVYGEVFEHFIILEIQKLVSYFFPDYRLSYLKTKDDAEIDLVIERPGLPLLLIEIKSTTQLREEDLSSFIKLTKEIGGSEVVCFSQDSLAKQYQHVMLLPWKQGLRRYFYPDSPHKTMEL